MKSIKNIGIFVLILFSAFTLNAQTKEEKKALKKETSEWKKKLKAMSAMDFKKAVEEKETLQRKSVSLDTDLQEAGKQVVAKDEEIGDARKKSAELEKQNPEIEANVKSEKGIVFKVQIGAYEKVDISSQANDQTDLGTENENSLKKYTLGSFKDYWKADKFKKIIQEGGVKDAWVVGYKDGKRTDIKELLKGVI
jgi:hypothetical protein